MPDALALKPHKQWTFEIDNTEYTIAVYLSVRLFTTFQAESEKGGTGKEAIAHTLFEALDSYEDKRPSYEKLLSCDDILSEYVMRLLESSTTLNDEYSKTSDLDDIYLRFQSTMKNYVKATLGDLVDASKINMQGISDALSSMAEVLPSFSNAAVQATKKLLDFSDLVKPIVLNINSMVSNFADSALRSISAILREIKTPTVSEERKQELLDSYIAWGQYGWSVLSCAPIDVYNELPSDANTADRIALSFLHKNDMKMLFEELKNNTKIKQSDLSEAIELYENKHYKACSMFLLSMIDAKLVRLQDKSSRKVGNCAIKRFEDKLKDTGKYDDILLYLLQYSNTVSCLKSIYATYPNFQNEPRLLNRNFIMHGMITRAVGQKDCKQLFVLLENIIELNDFLRDRRHSNG